MLLQTFVQLNILLLVAPAFAGWPALPAAHPLLAQAAQVVFLSTARQTQPAPQAVTEQRTSRRATAALHCIDTAHSLELSSLETRPVSAPFPSASFRPFPHAPRAP